MKGILSLQANERELLLFLDSNLTCKKSYA